MSHLQGRVALVTGAAGGIGSAVAERLAASGASIVATDVRPADLAPLVERLRHAGSTAIPFGHDVRSRSEWKAAVTAANELGGLDIVVNNAGITRDRTLGKMTDEEWQTVVDVHLTGTFLGCQHAVRAMQGRGWGRIVNVSSTVIAGSFGQANYAAAKAGIVGLTRTVALEGARHGILVNAIAPGSVDTPMLRAVPADLLEGYRREIPLQRFAAPSEIAATVAFLASDEASYITGQVIFVDGGATLG